MEIIQLTDADSPYFKTIVDWNYNWWGILNHQEYEEVKQNMLHSLNTKNHLPQTFICIDHHQVLGMYQIAYFDDIESRPDLYPWLMNVYVDSRYRNQGIGTMLMHSVKENALSAGIHELYLHTCHVGYYEKFGWEYLEEFDTFLDYSKIERLYHIQFD